MNNAYYNSAAIITRWLMSVIFILGLSTVNLTAQTTTFNFTGTIVTYTVPAGITSIQVDSRGAEGGLQTESNSFDPGKGARMTSVLNVTPGQVLKILVGGKPANAGTDEGGGGGGGSFITTSANVPLVIAGGGGGEGADAAGVAASITNNGTAANIGAPGGTGGNGGGVVGASTSNGSGGGGLLTDGADACTVGKGRSFLNGGAGGLSCGGSGSPGGFGGGGGGSAEGGGGGGGYSGGGGAESVTDGGGGGGSYISGAAQASFANFQSGNGQIIITELSNACVTPINQPTGLVLTPVASFQLNGTFTTAAGADNYLIIRYPNLTVPSALPVDGTIYNVGDVIGNGIVAAVSNSGSFSATGLTLSTSYDFYVYSANSICSGGPLYLTSSPLTGTATTPAGSSATAIGGLWSSPATWAAGIVPPITETVIIPAGSIVSVDQVVTAGNINLSGVLQWNGSSNAMTITGNLIINPTGRFLPYTTGATGQTVNIGGNLINNGFANLAMASAFINFNGSGSVLGGTGTFLGDGTRGIIRTLAFQNLGSNSISTSQPLTLTSGFTLTAGSLNTNGLLKIDNTAQVYGQPINLQVASISLNTMGTYTLASPVAFGVAVTQWTNITGVLNTVYVSGSNVYRCVTAANIGPAAPTHTSGISQNLLWIGTIGTLGTPFLGAQSHTVGTQYFYGGNLYVCTTGGAASTAAPPVHTSGIVSSGTAAFLYVGSPATVSVNYDISLTPNTRSVALTNPGSGYTSAPSISFSIGVVGSTVTTSASATVVYIQQIAGIANSLTQKSGVATISGGLIINSDQGVTPALSVDELASSGVGNISTSNGGVNYSIAPVVGFAGPTQLNLITDPGSGYITAPTITVTGGNLVSGSALTSSNFLISVNQGKVVWVSLNTGTTACYSTPPSLTLTSSPGVTATLAFPAGCWPAATANIGSNGQLTSFTMTNSGFGYVAAPTAGIGTTTATANGGTFTTVATAPTSRIALYQLTLNFFTPATSPAAQPDDGTVIPSNRKMQALNLNGNGNGITLTNNLTLFGTTPLALVASGNTPGNILNLNGFNVLFANNAYSGLASSTFNNAGTNAYLKNGSITMIGRAGSSTFNYPFAGNTTTGGLVWFAGSTPTVVTTGNSATRVTITELGAPSNSSGGTGVAQGNRSYRVQLNAGAATGLNPTIKLNFNSVDALTLTQDITYVAESNALSGPWNIKSSAFGVSGALPASGSLTTATVAPGPIAATVDNYYAFSSLATTITSFTPTATCGGGTVVITGTGFSGATAVSFGGTPALSFIVNSSTQITALVSNSGSTGQISVTSPFGTNVSSGIYTFNGVGPIISFVPGNSATICPGGSQTFTALPGGSGETYLWSPNAGSSTNQSVTLSAAGTYTVTVTNTGGCSNAAIVSIAISPTPAVTAVATPGSVCMGSSVSLAGDAMLGLYSQEFESSSFPLTSFGTSTNFTATQNSTFYAQGTSSVLFNTATTSTSGTLTNTTNINLNSTASAQLTFKHIAGMEGPTTSFDFGFVDYSIDGGTNWITFQQSSYVGGALPSLFLGTDVRFSSRSYANWNAVFTGSTSLPDNTLWQTETFNIPASALSSSQFRIRFRYTTDVSVFYFGWLIDDVKIIYNIPATYSWSSTPVGFTATTKNASATPSTNTAYTITVTDLIGCSFSANTAQVVVNPVPAPPVVSGFPNVCGSGTTTLTATPAPGNTISWFTDPTGGTAFFTGNSFTTPPLTGNVNYYVQENTAFCSSTRTLVTVNWTAAPAPVSFLEGSPLTICPGGSQTFTTLPGGNGETYLWSPNAGSSTNQSITTNAAGSYTVTVTFTNGCSNSATAVLIASPNPTVNATATPTALCAGSSSQLNSGSFISGSLNTPLNSNNSFAGNVFNITATNTVNITGFKMVISVGTLAEVWYKPGGYGCVTSLSSSAGWTQVGTAVPIVPAGGIPNLTNIPMVGTVTIPAGQTYGFVVVCNGTAHYTDGTTPCGAWANDVNIAISQGLGGSGMSGSFSFLNSVRNFNGQVIYSAGQPNLTYLWTESPAGSTLSSTTIIDPVASPLVNKTYTVQVTNDAGCSSTGSVNVTVNPVPPPPTITPPSATINAGSPVSFSATGVPGAIFSMYDAPTGGTLLFTGATYSGPGPASTTTFYVEQNDGLCSSVRTPVVITVIAIPPPVISGDMTVCGQQITTLTSSAPIAGNSIKWYSVATGGTAINTGTSFTTPILTGNITYYVAEENTVASSTRTAVNIIWNAPPSLAIYNTTYNNTGNVVFCGTTGIPVVNLDAASASAPSWAANGSTYFWSQSVVGGLSCLGSCPSTNSVDLNNIFPAQTSENITVQVSNPVTGCIAQTSVNVTAFNFPGFNASATPSSVCTGQSTQLSTGVSAQNFTVSSIPYAPVSPATTTVLCSGGVQNVPVNIGTLDDGGWFNVPLGFNFNFFGNVYTEVNVACNGNLQFGPTANFSNSFSPGPIPAGSVPNNFVAATWSDMLFTVSGSISYFVSGVAPTRVFAITWDGPMFGAPSTHQQVQALLYESTGVVEVHLLESNGVATTGGGVKTIGVEDLPGVIGAAAPGRNGSAWTTTVAEAWRFQPPVNYSFAWSTVPSSAFTSTLAEPVVTPASATNYQIIVSDPITGCSVTENILVQVNPYPVVSASPANSAVCYPLGTAAALTASGNAATYSWSPASGLNQTTGTSVTAMPPVSTTYTVTGTSALGCSTTATVSVNVTQAPTLAATSTPPAVCSGGNAQLQVLASLPGYNIGTNCGPGFVNIATTGTQVPGILEDDSEHAITFPGSGFTFNGTTYTDGLVSTNGVIVLGTNTGQITQVNGALPNTGITAGNVFLAAFWDDLDIDFSPTIVTQTVGNTFIIQWSNFGHFSTSPDAITFQIQLDMVTGVIRYIYPDVSFGDVAFDAGITATVGIQMSTTEAQQYSNNTASLIDGQCISFTPQVGNFSYAWTGPNLSSTSVYNPVAQNITGTQTYSVLVTDITTTCQNSTTVAVNMHPIPSITYTTDLSNFYCENQNINFDATGTGFGPGTPSYSWIGPGFSAATQDPTFFGAQVINSGNYTVTFTDGNGCTNTNTQYVEVNPNPVVNVTTTPVSCLNENNGTATFNMTIQPTYNDYAILEGSNTGSSNPQTFSGYVDGTYFYQVSELNTGCTSFGSFAVTTVPNVDPVIICPANMTVPNTPGSCGAYVNYTPPVGTDNCSNGLQTTLQAGPAPGGFFPIGTTVVRYRVTDEQMAFTECTFSVTVEDTEAPTYVGSSSCPASFTACNPVSWTAPLFQDNCPGLQVTSTHQPGVNFPIGVTPVTYTATDLKGNPTTCTFNVTVLDSSLAASGITSNRDFNNICIGGDITLSVNGGHLGEITAGVPAQWKWYSGGCGTSGGGVLVGTGSSVTLAPATTTTYYVRAEGGCRTTACVQLTVVVSTSGPASAPVYTVIPAQGAPGVTDVLSVAPVPGATFYRWFTNNGHINSVLFNGNVGPWETNVPTVNVTFVLPESNYHLRVIAGNACGRTNQSNTTIRGTVPAPTSMTGPTQACPASPVTYTIGAIPNNSPVTYNWALVPASAGTITMAPNGLSATVVFAAGFGTAQVCANGISTFGLPGPAYCTTVTSSAPVPGAITGNAAPCSGNPVPEVYSIVAVPSAISYSWTCSVPGAIVVQAGNGLSASISFPATNFIGTVQVTASSPCGTSAPSIFNISNGVPGDPGAINGASGGLCGALGVAFSVSTSNANSYLWTVTPGMSIVGVNNLNAVTVNFLSGFTNGTVSVQAFYSCGSVIKTHPVSGTPSAPIVAPAALCANSFQTYFVTNLEPSTDYTWTTSGDIADEYCSVGSSSNCTGYYIEAGPAGGSFTVTATNSCGAASTTSGPCRVMAENIDMKLYPNPTTGLVTVELYSKMGGNYKVSITDLSGRQVFSQEFKASSGRNQQEIDLGFANAGLYMVYIKDAQGNIGVQKLSVE